MNTTPNLLSRRGFAGWLVAAAALPATARTLPPALMLAREAPPDVDPAGFLVSEKYDGVRAVWDGARLRFRSGLPIAAPAWFTARLPSEPLDGELWLGRGRFEALAAAVRRVQPLDAEWRALRYMAFDQPGSDMRFAWRAARIERIARALGWNQLVAVEQMPVADRAALAGRLAAVVAAGGEGLVLHRADAAWRAGRSDALLKLKPLNDAEAVVVGVVPGSGRLEGRMGALRVRDDSGAEFAIGTGFSDAQRADPPAVGSLVSYTHRGVTSSGVPRFASFLRQRDPF